MREVTEIPANGGEAYEQGYARRDDPFWERGSTKSSPQSRQWSREWDAAHKAAEGETWNRGRK